jgi:ubiquinone/menaquinone biosynthesis C-methylase UbiE
VPPAAETLRKYERIAPLYDTLDAVYEYSWKQKLRHDVFRGLSGDVLDAGVGTGCNMVAYPRACRVTGVDLSPAMLARAGERSRSLGLDVTLRVADLSKLPFPDETFDAVVATFVLACVPENLQLAVLREMRRVLRPGGQIRLLDYRMSDRPFVRTLMKGLSVWLNFAFAASYTPGTERHVPAAGLSVVSERLVAMDVAKLTVLKRA